MGAFLGIDTSNYTTSVAVFETENQYMFQSKKLLPVAEGQVGLRQSDAVFHHTKQLPDMVRNVFSEFEGQVDGIGVSSRPCSEEGSYMPCFLAGTGLAQSVASVIKRPIFTFTHQQGHIAAAAYGAQKSELLQNPLLAFHVSGGTTDLIYVVPDKDEIIQCKRIAKSLDLKAGQLVDRVGHILGLPFPAGPSLDDLSKSAFEYSIPKIKPSIESGCCHLSGFENKCQAQLQQGVPANQIALYTFHAILESLSAMLCEAQNQYGEIPVLFAGGVMSNTYLRENLSNRFGGYFAPPAFSTDNACGIAWLASKKGM